MKYDCPICRGEGTKRTFEADELGLYVGHVSDHCNVPAENRATILRSVFQAEQLAPIDALLAQVREELIRASVWPLYHSAHEGYAVLLEEVDELWDEVKKKQSHRDRGAMIEEAVQVAAVAIRFILALGKDGEKR